MTDTDPVWSWPEERWRGVAHTVRAGRSMRPKKWKGGARAVVALSFNCLNETAELGTGNGSITRLSQGQYGARQGLPRILALLKAHGVPATFFMPAVAAMLAPAEAKAIVAGGHEIGLSGWIGEVQAALTFEAERDLATGARTALERLSGMRPVGLRATGFAFSEHTLGVIRELGLAYDSSLMADNEPYELLANDQPTGVIEIPVERIRDDSSYFSLDPAARAPSAPEAVFDIFRRELEVAYHEGGLFQLTLHPHLIGHRSRLWIIDELIKIARTLPGIWFATHGDVAAWCKSKAGG